MKCMAVACLTFVCVWQGWATVPDISGVELKQEGNKVFVSYWLKNAPAVVTVDFQTNATDEVWASIGAENFQTLSGDVNCRVEESSSAKRVLVWKPRNDWPGRKIAAGEFKAVVKAHAVTCPPTWMTIELATGAVRYFDSMAAVPEGIAGSRYRRSHVLLRKIPAACESFFMGRSPYEMNVSSTTDETPHEVSFTRDWYMAVFETTQGQYEAVMGSNPSAHWDGTGCCPVENVKYTDLRGSSNADWPTDRQASGESFFGILQGRTHMAVDLPTEAQWEYSCRAGTTTGLNNGCDLSADGGAGASIPELADVAWSSSNTDATHPVGMLTPNAWNLYDMHGNVQEFCLDWYGAYAGDEVDPVGPASGEGRVARGGSYQWFANNLRSAKRASATGYAKNLGFRICAEAVAR